MHGMKRQNGRHQGGRSRFGGPGEGHGMFGGRRGGGGGLGGGSGRRGKRFAGEELRRMVLALLEEQPQHGYQLIRSFAERSGEAYSPSPGVLYPLLTLLQDMSLIEDVVGEQKNRQIYALTDAGKLEVEAGRDAVAATFARLAAMGAEASRTDAGPVRRAMMNLRTAAVQRMGRDGADDQLAFAVAAILDEAAQKIERIQVERL